MTIGILYWLLMILWLVGYGYGTFRAPPNWPVVGPNILLFILLVCLGWKVFGSPIQ